MKTIILTLIFILCNLISNAQEQPISITVTITNIKNDNGQVLLGLHNENTFLNSKSAPLQSIKTPIINGRIQVQFINVTPGEYAIIALHDENNNQRMDFNMHQMPIEDYGTSNNEMSFGPPVFSYAKFIVTNKNLDFNIRF